METNYGLSAETVQRLYRVFRSYPKIEEAVLFGSRAKGNYKRGSDIDLALKGVELTWADIGDIAEAIDDLLMPYETDLLIYEQVNHDAVKEHIDRVGKVFYRRERP